jgi:hypothetical protein
MAEGIRHRIHEVVQGTNDQQDELEDAVLVGWVLVSEWMDPTGERWLSKMSGSNGGDSGPTRWTERGYLHEALYNWAKED